MSTPGAAPLCPPSDLEILGWCVVMQRLVFPTFSQGVAAVVRSRCPLWMAEKVFDGRGSTTRVVR